MKKVLTCLSLLIMCLACILTSFAHQGKTDGNGGHRDNNNTSGLGSYHFHCGGYPAHLHNNGVCPYSGEYTSGNDTSYSSNKTYSVKTATPIPTVKPKQSTTEEEQPNTQWLWWGIPSAVGAGWFSYKVFRKKG